MFFMRDLFPPIIKTLGWNVCVPSAAPGDSWSWVALVENVMVHCTGLWEQADHREMISRRHWVRMAGSLRNLTSSHPSSFTCHCALLWVFLGKRADSAVTLVSEPGWVTGPSALLPRNTQSKAQWQVNKEGCGFLAFASVPSLSALQPLEEPAIVGGLGSLLASWEIRAMF